MVAVPAKARKHAHFKIPRQVVQARLLHLGIMQAQARKNATANAYGRAKLAPRQVDTPSRESLPKSGVCEQ